MSETGRVSAATNMQLGQTAIDKNSTRHEIPLPLEVSNVIEDTIETGDRDGDQTYFSQSPQPATSDDAELFDDVGSRLDVWG